jgi:hypothetical protein
LICPGWLFQGVHWYWYFHQSTWVAVAAITAYVIGRVKIYNQDVHQLAFTSPDVDWQLWVIGGESPRIVRAESVN